MSDAGLFLRSSVSTMNKSPSQYLSAFKKYPMDRAGTTLVFQMVYPIFLPEVSYGTFGRCPNSGESIIYVLVHGDDVLTVGRQEERKHAWGLFQAAYELSRVVAFGRPL